MYYFILYLSSFKAIMGKTSVKTSSSNKVGAAHTGHDVKNRKRKASKNNSGMLWTGSVGQEGDSTTERARAETTGNNSDSFDENLVDESLNCPKVGTYLKIFLLL